MRIPHSLLLIFAILVLVSGSVALGQVKPDNTKQDSVPIVPPVPKNPETVGAAVDPNKYLIGPEDVLFIKTWREQDFSIVTAVRPDGKITMSLLGDIPAAGFTPAQLAVDVKERVAKYVNNPDVSVIVQEVRSRKYYMDGEFRKTGVFALVTPISVMEAISIASGFNDFADKKHVRVLRGTKTFNFNYLEAQKGKHPEQNIVIESGDHIIAK